MPNLKSALLLSIHSILLYSYKSDKLINIIKFKRSVMTVNKVSLNDRFDVEKKIVIASGTQALVRLMLNQAVRDRQMELILQD